MDRYGGFSGILDELWQYPSNEVLIVGRYAPGGRSGSRRVVSRIATSAATVISAASPIRSNGGSGSEIPACRSPSQKFHSSLAQCVHGDVPQQSSMVDDYHFLEQVGAATGGPKGGQ
jgi:hypothetical protein